MRIAELVESLDLPQTQVAERAWEGGRRRVRRRKGALAAGGAAVAVACVIGLTVAGRSGDATTPTPAPSPTRTVEPRTAPLVQRLLIGKQLRKVIPNIDFQRFGGHPEQAVPLSTHPVDRAAIAMASYQDDATVLVLGEDGEWRRVDVPGLVPVRDESGYTSPIVRPTSLSPDDTKLALPQPNALVVVDLTDGTSRRYDVPGEDNHYVIWDGKSHVIVAREPPSTARWSTSAMAPCQRPGTALTRDLPMGPSSRGLGIATLSSRASCIGTTDELSRRSQATMAVP
jgi:hypothetical protein